MELAREKEGLFRRSRRKFYVGFTDADRVFSGVVSGTLYSLFFPRRSYQKESGHNGRVIGSFF